ncbi:MAG TPA: MBL fold metallo-hydrolase [Candidatus Sulfotelmatobacter sp.]|nr:MBL fold metallo-hydrolase [Candidatus Sulfotelmatobacter sp.]
MKHQIPLEESARADTALQNPRATRTRQVAVDLACKRLAIVNVVFYGKPGSPDRQWVLIDTGIPGTAGVIARAAVQRFGRASRPAAILLTHGHFDHVGALENLAARWDAPIYAHVLEQPFLNGTSSYPPPDPTVGGGLMAALSPLYPRGPINVSPRLKVLPQRGEVPGMPGWRWLPTPGHSPGHVSLWRESDRALIAGDAFITTNQESAYSVATQRPELHGPPQYYTPDWPQARASVQRLAALEPELVITGHGRPMHGDTMRAALHLLVRDFDRIAVPEHGHYVRAAA